MFNVIVYKRLLDDSSSRLKLYFKNHSLFLLHVLQKTEKLKEDIELYQPHIVIVDYATAIEKRMLFANRFKKNYEELYLGVAIPDMLGDKPLQLLMESGLVDFLVSESGNIGEYEFQLRFAMKDREHKMQFQDYRKQFESIKDEFDNYLVTLQQKEEIIASLEENIKSIMTFDPLTSLDNERQFKTKMESTLDECRRYKENAALLYILVDNREQIEEVYGREGIDSVYIEISQVIKKLIRRNDVVGIRDNHNSFMVLYKKIRVESVRTVSMRMKQQLEDHVFLFNQRQIRLTVSIGLASSINYKQNSFELDTLSSWAQVAFDNAIKKGGNALVAYS